MKDIPYKTLQSGEEAAIRSEMLQLLRSSPIPEDELLANLGLFFRRQLWTRYLFLNDVYRQVLDVHGIVIEFGVRWGQSLAMLLNLRGILEPYNYTRKIVGFDTFSGFTQPRDEDGRDGIVRAGAYRTTERYEEFLDSVLANHEAESPIAHIRKFEIVKGDATKTLPEYLARHPETVIALAYFDFDIYEPTHACLEAILPHLPRGAVVAFDQVGNATFPGETRAVDQVVGLSNLRLRRSPVSAGACFAVWGD